MDKRLLPFLTLLSACSLIPSVGPDYETPQNPEVTEWREGMDKNPLFVATQNSRVAWWAQLKDPVLNDLIEKAIKENPSYEIASSKLKEARANRRIAFGSFLPMVDASYSATRSGSSENTPNAQFMESPINTYQAGFDASWEIDLFGGNRRAFEAAYAEEDAAEASVDDTGVSVAAEVAKNYVELRSFEKRLSIAESNLKIQTESRDLVQAKFNAGVSSELDLSQANSQLEATRSTVPTLEGEMKRRLYRLATLCGQAPQGFTLLGAQAVIPQFDGAVGISQPSELLRTRPDVRIAERNLAAQTARVGVAISDLFPKLTLLGSVGVQSTKSGSLFDADSRRWSVGPSITMPIFHGGQILGNIDVQEERTAQALSSYEQTVLGALEDAQNTLNSYTLELDRVRSLQKSLEASARALSLSRDLYTQGLTDFLRVIEAQRAVFSAEDSYIDSQAKVALSGISVYKAFAGGLPIPEKDKGDS